MNYIVLNNVKKILIITLFILFFTGKISAYAVIWENPQNINVYIPQIDDRTKLMKKAFIPIRLNIKLLKKNLKLQILIKGILVIKNLKE